jgi:hypothetical protein
MELRSKMMGLSITEDGSTIRGVGSEELNILMELYMMDIGLIIRSKGVEQ